MSELSQEHAPRIGSGSFSSGLVGWGEEDASRKHIVYPTIPLGLKGLGERKARFFYVLYHVILLLPFVKGT